VSVILEFPSGQSVFTCSTQLVPYQRMQFLADERTNRDGIIRLMRRTTGQRGFLWMMGATYLAGGFERRRFRFAISIRCRGMRSRGRSGTGASFRCPGDAIANMAVIEAVFRAGESERWERP